MTGRSATFIVPEETVAASDVSLGSGSEFALFTPDGTCAGHAVWTGGALAMAVWADDPQTDERDGFIAGDDLRLAVWDARSATEYESVSARLNESYVASPVFASDAVYLVDALITPGDDDPAGIEENFAFDLNPTYPNPFVDATTIGYSVAEPAEVAINVYTMLGQHVAELVNESKEPGRYEVTFRPPPTLSSGTYIYRLTSDSYSEFHRMTFIR